MLWFFLQKTMYEENWKGEKKKERTDEILMEKLGMHLKLQSHIKLLLKAEFVN